MAATDGAEFTLKLSRPEQAALLTLADYGLAAITEYALVRHTGLTERAIDKLRARAESRLTKPEALALLNAVQKGLGAVRAFGLPAELDAGGRAEEKLRAIAW